ncbi:DNA-binding transcriptional regulator GbsR (MarR family) [Halomonas fontilapidosi]|uniref:HTH-type transcriptional regulator n=1 Tax=Halomonas fontilapidosi TaxID=616675 RepID=A0A7W5H0Z4_9GAMM|nr:transcriptional regulator [Halomonas fontilapidosi]MBB3185811.1 DNA-binding transcriptional regulator GbsR (MarR family) [Halomonas fontilapidosi]
MQETDAQRLEEARDVMISALAQSMVAYGMTPSVGRIYAVLYFAASPLTLDDIKDEVAMSKASVSTGVRELIDSGMVVKVWKKGDRKDHYIAEKDFFKNFLNFMIKMLRLERGIMQKAVEQTEPVMREIAQHGADSDTRALAARDHALVSDSRPYLRWIMQMANAMESGEIFEHFPRPERDERQAPLQENVKHGDKHGDP